LTSGERYFIIIKIINNYYTNNPVRASTGFDRDLESGEAIRREMR